MIDSVAALPEPSLARRKTPEASAFSYAEAAAALENNAGQSLKAFGGKPQSAPEARPKAPTNAEAEAPVRSERQASARASTEGAEAPNAAPTQASIAATPVAAPTVATDGARQSAATLAPQSGAPAGTVATTAAAAPAAKSTSTAVSGEAPTVRHSQNAAKLAGTTAPTPLRSPEEFAELIARRLDDGATEFELRLDPPELGRIEARLVVGEDGATELRIKFDNQAAYDLFARDEAGLRLAFADAGYSFGGGGLAFVLDEQRSHAGALAPEASSPDAPRAYSAFVAARALDVKV